MILRWCEQVSRTGGDAFSSCNNVGCVRPSTGVQMADAGLLAKRRGELADERASSELIPALVLMGRRPARRQMDQTGQS